MLFQEIISNWRNLLILFQVRRKTWSYIFWFFFRLLLQQVLQTHILCLHSILPSIPSSQLTHPDFFFVKWLSINMTSHSPMPMVIISLFSSTEMAAMTPGKNNIFLQISYHIRNTVVQLQRRLSRWRSSWTAASVSWRETEWPVSCAAGMERNATGRKVEWIFGTLCHYTNIPYWLHCGCYF